MTTITGPFIDHRTKAKRTQDWLVIVKEGQYVEVLRYTDGQRAAEDAATLRQAAAAARAGVAA